MTEAGPTTSPATDPQRTHPLTVLVTVLRTIPALLGIGVIMVAQGGSGLRDVVSGQDGAGVGLVVVALVGLALLAVVAALVGLVSWLSWSRRVYYFDAAGDLRVDSGVLTRQQRRLALSRLQAVDVNQPLLARVVGMAEVKVEVAGAGDSRITLQYLTMPQAQALRDQVLARAAGLRPDVGTAPQNVLVSVPTRDLVLSLLLSSTTLVGVLATAGLVAVTVLVEGTLGLAVLITGGVPIFAAFGQFVRYFGFTVAESPDGLRLRSGLTSTQAQTVPPGRVHAVEYEQPLLWRHRDWVRVSLTIAGATSGEDGQQSGFTGVLLPVAPREVAAAVVDRVMPGLGGADAYDWVPAPPRVRIRAPIQWRQLAAASDDRVLAVRRGRLVRRLAVVPHARTQSVHVTQGPWQRHLDVATVQVDIAPGPISVQALHQDARTARALADLQVERTERAMAVAGPERWMSDREPQP